MNDDKLDLLVELLKTSKDETNRRIDDVNSRFDDVNRRIDDSKESNLLLHNNHKEVTETNFQSLRDCINTNQRVVGTAITIFGILLAIVGIMFAIVGIMLAILMFMTQEHAHSQEFRDDELRQDKVSLTLNRWEYDPNIYLVGDTTVEEARRLALDDREGKRRKE